MKNYRQILKKIEKIEAEHGDFENYVRALTNLDDFHMMRMEEAVALSMPHMGRVYQDLAELELADLWDFNFQFGKSDGEFF